MMRPTGARFRVCARVLMTSLAANNILPFRIGDIMRVFTYAGDLGASPSVILSTVILEKLLDIFVLVLLFVATMGSMQRTALHLIADVSLGHLIGRPARSSCWRTRASAQNRRLFTRYWPEPEAAEDRALDPARARRLRIGIAGSLLLAGTVGHHLDLRGHDLRLAA